MLRYGRVTQRHLIPGIAAGSTHSLLTRLLSLIYLLAITGTEYKHVLVFLKGKGKAGIAVHGTPSHSYGVSLAIWDHTVLPSTRHK